MNYVMISVLAMVAFGADAILTKFATTHASPDNVAILRSLSATVVIGLYMVTLSDGSVNSFKLSSYTPVVCLAGIFLGAAFILMVKAFVGGPVSVVAPIMGLSVVIPVLFGVLALHEPVNLSKALGIALACVAIVLISR